MSPHVTREDDACPTFRCRAGPARRTEGLAAAQNSPPNGRNDMTINRRRTTRRVVRGALASICLSATAFVDFNSQSARAIIGSRSGGGAAPPHGGGGAPYQQQQHQPPPLQQQQQPVDPYANAVPPAAADQPGSAQEQLQHQEPYLYDENDGDFAAIEQGADTAAAAREAAGILPGASRSGEGVDQLFNYDEAGGLGLDAGGVLGQDAAGLEKMEGASQNLNVNLNGAEPEAADLEAMLEAEVNLNQGNEHLAFDPETGEELMENLGVDGEGILGQELPQEQEGAAAAGAAEDPAAVAAAAAAAAGAEPSEEVRRAEALRLQEIEQERQKTDHAETTGGREQTAEGDSPDPYQVPEDLSEYEDPEVAAMAQAQAAQEEQARAAAAQQGQQPPSTDHRRGRPRPPLPKQNRGRGVPPPQRSPSKAPPPSHRGPGSLGSSGNQNQQKKIEIQQSPGEQVDVSQLGEEDETLWRKAEKAWPVYARWLYSEIEFYTMLQTVKFSAFLYEYPPLAVFYVVALFLFMNFFVWGESADPVVVVQQVSGAGGGAAGTRSASPARPRARPSGRAAAPGAAAPGTPSAQTSGLSPEQSAQQRQELEHMKQQMQSLESELHASEQRYRQLLSQVEVCATKQRECEESMQKGAKRDEMIYGSLTDMVSDLQLKTQEALNLIHDYNTSMGGGGGKSDSSMGGSGATSKESTMTQ